MDVENHTLALLREMRGEQQEMREALRRVEESQTALFDLVVSVKAGESATLTRLNAPDRRLTNLERRAGVIGGLGDDG